MEKIYTERAHLMCPNMNFGIIISVKAEYNESSIIKSVTLLSEAHPFLKSLLGINEDDSSYFYSVTKHSQIKIICKKESIRNINDEIIFDDYTKLTSMEWDLTQEGMLKVLAYKNNDKTLFLLIFHHLLTDGRGAFMLANELAACYVSGIKPCPSLEKLISTKKDFPKNSKLSFISSLLIKYANKKWIKENHKVTYKEYLELANNFVANNIIERSIQIIGNKINQELASLVIPKITFVRINIEESYLWNM